MLVSSFLIERLENAGVKHVFGVPGDYILEFYKELWDSPKIKAINNTDEAHSGFAADGYARVNGVGCVVVTYNVGASKVINAVQCAYAERSPLIVISGAPGLGERDGKNLLHHTLGRCDSQRKMFRKITCASAILDDPATAGLRIDAAFEALHYYKRPIYIELPRDVARKAISYDVYKQGTPTSPVTDPENLQEAEFDVLNLICGSKRPAILAGVEIARYKLSEQMVKFAEKHGIPVATTLLSKSVINERSRVFAGVYFGDGSHDHTKKLVEESDCLLIFGDYHHDTTLCFRPARFDKRQIVWSNVESLRVHNHSYTDVGFSDFAKRIFKSDLGNKWDLQQLPTKDRIDFDPQPGTKITSDRLFAKIDSVLSREHAICADIGDSLFGAMDLTVHNSHHFLSPAYYTSMGASIPYAVGLQMAKPDVRPIVLIGDGAFQMSGLELSTSVQHKGNPIVIVLNNDGYTTERLLIDGGFNDLRRWNYHKVCELIGGGQGRVVSTEEELDAAVKEAITSKELFVINVLMSRTEVSQGLRRMTEALGNKV